MVRFVRSLAERGDEAPPSTPDRSAQDCRGDVEHLEERRPLRSRASETASSLSARREPRPTAGSSYCWPIGLSKRSGRGRVSNPPVRRYQVRRALSLIVNPMPPRTTEESYRPRVSDRTMVAEYRDRFADCASEIEWSLPSFPSSWIFSERSSPSRVHFAAPNYGAPLTAPGRSEEFS